MFLQSDNCRQAHTNIKCLDAKELVGHCKFILIPLLNFLACLFQIENMDSLFEAQFSPLSDSGCVLSKCGKCLRYMKYISSLPSRLYCNTCEEVYYVPQKGTIKVILLALHLFGHWLILFRLKLYAWKIFIFTFFSNCSTLGNNLS